MVLALPVKLPVNVRVSCTTVIVFSPSSPFVGPEIVVPCEKASVPFSFAGFAWSLSLSWLAFTAAIVTTGTRKMSIRTAIQIFLKFCFLSSNDSGYLCHCALPRRSIGDGVAVPERKTWDASIQFLIWRRDLDAGYLRTPSHGR